MKTLLAFLCLTLSAHAQIALNNAFYNTLNGPRGVNYGYFLQEDFEAPGYENVWTQAGSGTINDQANTAPAPLLGSYSLRLALSGDGRRTTNAFASSHSTVYGFAMVYFQTRPNQREFFGLWNDGTRLLDIGVLTGNQLYFDDGTVSQSTGTTLANNTLYYIWWRYTKGSGANAVYEIAVSTDINTKPTTGASFETSTAGASTLDANRFVVGATAGVATFTVIVDKIRLSVNTIGTNPL